MTEETQIFSGEILEISYNIISVKRDDNKKIETIYFDGLQKRVLSDVPEEIIKRIKRVEWTDGEFWERGVNPIVCCDDCNNGLFPLCNDNDAFGCDLKENCRECDKWLCDDCIKDRGLCNSCLKNTLVEVLAS